MNILADTKRLEQPSIISYMSLAPQARAMVKRVCSGQTIIVKDDGEDQAILIDPIDYRILLAMLAYRTAPVQQTKRQKGATLLIGLHESELSGMATQECWNRVISAYLDEEINLGRAANLLKISRLSLDERFQQLKIPRRIGPVDIEDARSEINVALNTLTKAGQLASN